MFLLLFGHSGGSGMSRLSKALAVVLMLAILASIAVIVYLVVIPRVGERFTEFYVLSLEGKADGYPGEVRMGEAASVILGIVNQEHEEVDYRVEIAINGVQDTEIGPVPLAHKEKWEQVVTFIPRYIGDNQKVEFGLYRNGGVEPYRKLDLWIDVKGQRY